MKYAPVASVVNKPAAVTIPKAVLISFFIISGALLYPSSWWFNCYILISLNTALALV